MKMLYLLVLMVPWINGIAQSKLLSTGTVDSIHSQILNGQRKLYIHVPASAKSNPDKKYPVIYLLDGDWNFNSVVGMVDFLSSVNGNSFCPEMIVVGIPITERVHDLTPTRVTSGLWIDSHAAEKSGGGDNFISFIEKEVMPYVDSHFPTTKYRTLIGHSLGGLLAMHTLIHHSGLFQGYIVIDPSMWWDRQKLLLECRDELKRPISKGTSLFLAMANTLPTGMDTVSVQKDTTSETIHARSILQLARYSTSRDDIGLQSYFKFYEQDTHSSVPLIATYDALHELFKDYSWQVEDRFITDNAFQLAGYMQSHFANISNKYGIMADDGSILLPPFDLVYNLAYFVSTKNQYAKAESLYQLNIKNNPTDPRVFDIIGDFYASRGDKARAIANYKKALSIKDTKDTKEKLLKLKAK